ncbi:hypothetical protein HAX54_044137 [Datura stramonium]|uniref:Secreted protein n=1 Tax=Datura stramonium TaxID=4076 RepID=A0ABS8W5L5_DATST|nr:hypothetical protein [Datura stramonium]
MSVVALLFLAARRGAGPARTIAFIVNRRPLDKGSRLWEKSFLCRALVKVVKRASGQVASRSSVGLPGRAGTNEEEHSTLRTRLANQSKSGQLLLNGVCEPSVLQNRTSGPPLKLPGLVPNQPFIQHCYNRSTHSSTGRSAFSVCYGFQPGSRRFGRLCPEPSRRHLLSLEKRLNSCEPLVSWRTAGEARRDPKAVANNHLVRGFPENPKVSLA